MTAIGVGPTADPAAEVDLVVIVPCHNVADTLAEQLEALVGERWSRPWRIVVVDNRSTDGTEEVALEYAHRGVSVVRAAEGKGVAYARNAGVRATRSAAVAFCDGDDVVGRGWVAAIGDALDHHELVGGETETTSLNEPWLARSRPMGRPGHLASFAAVAFASGCNCGMRRSLFDRLGGYDESFIGLEDIELSLRAHAGGADAQFVGDALVSYRLRPNPRDIWRQGAFYGHGRPDLILRARELGIQAPSPVAGLRSWAWLLIHLPSLRHRAGRYQALWVVAFRVGVLRSAVRHRRLFI